MDNLCESSLPFPIADMAGGPSFAYSQAELTLTFVDYRETPREVSFVDVAHFCIASIDADSRGLIDDRSYVVQDSSLIRRLAEIGDIQQPNEYTHQIICFNEIGQFMEIVFREMRHHIA